MTFDGGGDAHREHSGVTDDASCEKDGKSAEEMQLDENANEGSSQFVHLYDIYHCLLVIGRKLYNRVERI